MARIRFVGHARGGRCVFCHDGLGGDVARCEECRASWHVECLEGGRCPTLGCAAPTPAVALVPPVVAPIAAAPTTIVVPPPAPAPEANELGGRSDDPRWVRRRGRRRPGLRARIGPYSRLLMSGVAHLALLVAAVALVAVVVTHPAAAWRLLRPGSESSVGAFLASAGLVGLACASAWLAGRWLLRLPGVARELGELLDQTTPTLMDLQVLLLPDARGMQRWCLRLQGRPRGPYAGQRWDFPVSFFFSPWWLTMWGARRARPVLVYGLPPPGPYVIEFEDGALVLVHPDAEAPPLLEVPPPTPGPRRKRRRRGHGR